MSFLQFSALLVLYAMNAIAGQTGRSFNEVFADTAPGFALVVAILMVLEMAGSQLLISFIERHVNRLKEHHGRRSGFGQS